MPPSDARSDQELISAANRGDATAFESLYLRYRDWALRLAARFTGDRDAALDVVQDAWLYVLRKFPGFELTAQMTTFLYPVVKNVALTRRRRSACTDAALEHLPGPAGLLADDPRAELVAVLASLSADHREVLLMRFVDDLQLNEIATALGIPLGTVKSRLHHALAALRTDERVQRYFEP